MKLRPGEVIDLPPLPHGGLTSAGGYSSLDWTGILTRRRGPVVIGSRGTLEPRASIAPSIGGDAGSERPIVEGLNLLPTEKDLARRGGGGGEG